MSDSETAGGRPDDAVRLEVLWRGARDGLWDWDLATGDVRYSDRWKAIVGCSAEEIPNRPDEWFRRVHPRDLDDFKTALDAFVQGRIPDLEHEMRMLHKDGGWRWVVCRGAASSERSLLGGSLTDVTSTKTSEDRVLHEAFHDSLTGLPNRTLFLDRLGQALYRQRRRNGAPVAVLYLDLDRFRTVNDSLGVRAGDELLVQVRDLLSETLRLGDSLARLGGDKFAILLDGVRGPEEAVATSEDIGRRLAEPTKLAGHDIFASASIGIALAGEAHESPQDLLRDAISAMHQAKEDGATLYRLFDPETGAHARERLRLEADLHHAIERGEFLLHYQPIISFQTGRLSSFEALVRWRHPERGLVRPDLFIPVAEDNGMIVALGQWVLEQACTQMKQWQSDMPASRDISVAVNLSARQFDEPDLVASVEACLERTQLESRSLKLEMTESVVMEKTRENTRVLQELRDLGVRLLIDDFGTGYSSLSSLHTFPLDTLKIDRSFVSRMEFEDEKAEIVRTILALARKLGMDAVAEGVETPEQLEMLRGLECEYGQGYYFSSAVDGESAARWIESARAGEMDPIEVILAVIAFAAIGACLWLLRERYRLTSERDLARARLGDEERAREGFQSMAGKVMRQSNEEFLRLAKETMAADRNAAVAEMDQRRGAVDELVKPIRDAIRRTHDELTKVGKEHAGLRQQVTTMTRSNQELRTETGRLTQALRKPNVRGRYGEIQLERVVELAGMRSYCDFTTQEHMRDDDGQLQRPDLIVRLPNERMIAIDAKTSIDAYLDSIDTEDPEETGRCLDRYAENVQLQVQRLSRKKYWTQFDHSPELVVMFIPGDQLIDAALDRRPELIEYAAELNVIIASPSTLIGLLRAVHVGWREKNLSDSAEELFDLGRELHRRAAIVIDRAAKVGTALDGARKHYNDFVGSVQGRLLPTLRKFEERDARSVKEIVELKPIDGEARSLEPLDVKDGDVYPLEERAPQAPPDTASPDTAAAGVTVQRGRPEESHPPA